MQSVGRLAPDRTGHAMAATPPAPQLGAANGDDLDAGLAQKRVGIGIAVVGHDHTGLESDDVVAVVPLLPLGLPAVAAGPDHPQLLEAEGLLHDIEHASLVLADLHAALVIGRVPAVALDLVDHLAEHRADIA